MTKKAIKLSYSVPILEKGFENDDFFIEGTAINAAITSNNHKFLAEELEPAAESLNGVPLLIDHVNEIASIKGRVINGIYDSVNEKVNFKAKVIDKEIKSMIKDGRIDSVSIGASAEDIEEDGGFYIPRGIQFKELSLVAIPADSGATFQIALKEAYQSNSNELKGGLKMSEEEIKTEEPKEEVVKEVEAEAEKPEETKEQPTEDLSESLKTLSKEIKSLKKQITEMADVDEEKEEPKEETKVKETEEETEEETKEEAEDEEVFEEKGYKIVQGFGSLKGGSFTLIR